MSQMLYKRTVMGMKVKKINIDYLRVMVKQCWQKAYVTKGKSEFHEFQPGHPLQKSLPQA